MEPMDTFDPKICEQHLQECLKRVLRCYDDLELLPDCQWNISEMENRCFLEALYQIFNLGSTEALTRGLSLSREIR